MDGAADKDLQAPKVRPPWKRAEPVLTPAQRRSLVERRIAEAMAEGKFDNLPGAGRPLELDQPPPGREELWWALRMMKQARFTTDEVRYRKTIERLRGELEAATDEAAVRRIAGELNAWIVKLNTMGTNVIPTSLAPVDEEEAAARVREHRGTP
jgi:hypothetical protein